MTNMITVTIQMGDGEPTSASFGLPPDAEDDFGFDEAPPTDQENEDALDMAMPPEVSISVNTGSLDLVAPPDYDLDEDDFDEDDIGGDGVDDVLPPDV